jgi:hypothetical protein
MRHLIQTVQGKKGRHSITRLERSIQVNGKEDLEMARGNKSGKMVLNI